MIITDHNADSVRDSFSELNATMKLLHKTYIFACTLFNFIHRTR